MDAHTESELRKLFMARVAGQAGEIRHSLRQIAAGNPLGSEKQPERLISRIATKVGVPRRTAELLAERVSEAATRVETGGAFAGAESLQGPTIDFVGIEFLAKGRLAANCVGRIVYRSGVAQGSGFMVAPGLLLTNNHVIDSPEAARQMLVQFDYENDVDGRQRPLTHFELDPDKCFVNEPTRGLDFALVAVGHRVGGANELASFGFNALSASTDRHALGEIANIIQHPQGRLKEVVVRENNLVSRDETVQVLHYLGDTERGSSGSPVCNNEWEPIALHHWGEPALEMTNVLRQPLRSDVNEGVRISAIAERLRARAGELAGSAGAAVKSALTAWEQRPRGGPVSLVEGAQNVVGGPITVRTPQPDIPAATGSVVVTEGADVRITIPLEISIRLGGELGTLVGATKVRPDGGAPDGAGTQGTGRTEANDDFSDRDGYEPGFIQGFVIPLPDTSRVPYRLAKNRLAAQGDNPHELRYHHFSVVMNADRQLAAFTACNINGARLVAVNRQTKETKEDPSASDLGVESLSGAEASDDFRPDSRVLDSEQMARPFYEKQVVPGHILPKAPPSDAPAEVRRAYQRAVNERTARMFQKGHLTLRGDPAWGTPEQALLAEEDTFYYTNAAPQLGFFNQGSPEDKPAAKGKLRWRAVESYVLRNAVTMKQRVTVFAGPVFDDSYDVPYRFDSLLPMRFWKVAVWHDGNALRSVALLADQKPVLERLTKGVPESAEGFADPDELLRVSEFLTTVEHIQELTRLKFSKQVVSADIRAKASPEALLNLNPGLLRGQ